LSVPCKKKIGMLEVEKKAGVEVSEEWTDSEIISFGAN
jgi:hypothetical protein